MLRRTHCQRFVLRLWSDFPNGQVAAILEPDPAAHVGLCDPSTKAKAKAKASPAAFEVDNPSEFLKDSNPLVRFSNTGECAAAHA